MQYYSEFSLVYGLPRCPQQGVLNEYQSPFDLNSIQPKVALNWIPSPMVYSNGLPSRFTILVFRIKYEGILRYCCKFGKSGT